MVLRNISDVKVAVIVPVYNAEKTVRACVESIQNQSYENLEIIIVNDGSVDGSGAVCDKIAECDERIKVFHQENQGVSQARNLGIEKTTSKYLCFVDSDDTVESDMVETLLSVMVDNDSQMSVGGVEMCYTDFSKKQNEEKCIWNLNELDFDGFSNLSEKWIMAPMWCKMFLSDIIKSNNIKVEKGLICGEDHLFVFDYLKYCSKIAFTDACLYKYNCYNSPGGRFFPLSGQIKIFESKRAFVKSHCKNSDDTIEKFSSAYALHNLKVRVFYHIRKNLNDVQELNEARGWYWKYIFQHIKSEDVFFSEDYKWLLDNKKALCKGDMKKVLNETNAKIRKDKKRKKMKQNLKEIMQMSLKEKISWFLNR